MTTKEMLAFVRRYLKDGTGSLAFRETIGSSSTTSSIVLPSLTNATNNLLKGKEIKALDGNNAGESRKVVSWTQSGTIALVSPAFPFSFSSGATVDVLELGSWPGSVILPVLNEAQNRIVVDVHSRNFIDFTTWSEKDAFASSTNFYASVELPFGKMAKLLAVFVDEEEAVEYQSRNELNNGYIDAGFCRLGRQLDQAELAKIIYVPNVDANVKFQYIKRPSEITTADDCELPEIFHEPICRLAIGNLFSRDDQLLDKAGIHMSAYNEFVKNINSVP